MVKTPEAIEPKTKVSLSIDTTIINTLQKETDNLSKLVEKLLFDYVIQNNTQFRLELIRSKIPEGQKWKFEQDEDGNWILYYKNKIYRVGYDNRIEVQFSDQTLESPGKEVPVGMKITDGNETFTYLALSRGHDVGLKPYDRSIVNGEAPPG